MHRIKFAALFFGFTLLSLLAADADAQFFTGMKLLEVCENKDTICMGYVAAVADVQPTNIATHWRDLPRASCLPDSMQLGQAYLVTTKFLRENPSRLHEPAWVLVESALVQAFPCSKSK